MKALARDGHPFQSFSTGNLETLQKLPESLGINTRDLVIDFYKKHYSANIMKLVVYGKESLDTLQVTFIVCSGRMDGTSSGEVHVAS